MSNASRPHDLGLFDDARNLGICLRMVTIADGFETRAIEAGDACLVAGFHEVEGEGSSTWRWTAGRALLPHRLWTDLTGTILLRIDLHHAALPRWVRRETASAHMIVAA